ncbi:MAG: hypothetical protein PSX81_08960 [bacterium]|nr:hypothetical protein [bacterium]
MKTTPNPVCSIFDVGYRFGFGGIEKSMELGEYYDYDYRVYDARLGRFLSMDPDNVDFPSVSAYSFAINSPNIIIDKKGKFPWVSGFIGGVVNVAIGYVQAKIEGKDYDGKTALKDFVVGFAVGSGAALIGSFIKVATTTNVALKIVKFAGIGAVSSMTSNALDQTYNIYMDKQKEFEPDKVLVSGLVGLVTGAGAGLIGPATETYFTKMGEKMFKDFTKGELNQYAKIQAKYLKQWIFEKTGKKVGERELKRQVKEKTKEWADLKINEISGVMFTATEGTKATSDIIITIGTTEIVKKATEQ